ncbi:MAG TPA: hypothetical protein VFD83_02375, partial [Candidatus Polarisedimenticolia bacterium]|nr:hypothetical protein [Candidatus Polarisedimenticolia bacterium]
YQFAPKDTSFLASLVLEDRNKKPIRLDFESNGSAEPDVWREGDGGEISGESFKILFILRGRNETFLAYSWAAEEGEDLALLRCPAGKSVFDLPVFAYRYWVPY